MASTITVFDIAERRAHKPVEIGRVELPLPLGTFVNNRVSEQPNSTAFQFDVDAEERFLYVVMQRINQTDANDLKDANILHTVRIAESGARGGGDATPQRRRRLTAGAAAGRAFSGWPR